jgi:hypothetical protein
MNGQRWLGLALMVAGVGVLVFGISRLMSPGGLAAASPTPTPTASAVATSALPAASPTPDPPTPTPIPPLGETDVRAFVEVLVTAIQTGDLNTLIANLHPATMDRYGEAACRTAVAGFTDPTFEIEILSVQDPAPWDYVTDELITTIPDARAVPGNRSAGGVTVPLTFHFAQFGDAVRWFTDCGSPL